jgi:hypothetical protein
VRLDWSGLNDCVMQTDSEDIVFRLKVCQCVLQ